LTDITIILSDLEQHQVFFTSDLNYS